MYITTSNFLCNCKIEVLECPSHNPDINPIENLWSILDAEIPLEKRINKRIFLEELKIQQIDKNYLEKLVESTPNTNYRVFTYVYSVSQFYPRMQFCVVLYDINYCMI